MERALRWRTDGAWTATEYAEYPELAAAMRERLCGIPPHCIEHALFTIDRSLK